MKNKVIAKRKSKGEVSFYLRTNDGDEHWLLDQTGRWLECDDLCKWFGKGRFEDELLGFSHKNKSKRFCKTVENVVRTSKYVTKYIINAEDDDLYA